MQIEELIQLTLRRFFHDETLRFDKSRFAGGLTNYNYIMTIHGKDYVIRQPGGMTERMIDRQTELENNTQVSQAGINCPCLYFDAKSGIKITTYVPGSRNLSHIGPQLKEHIQIVISLMKQVHQLKKPFPNRFDWLSELTKYETIIQEQRGELFTDHGYIKEQLCIWQDMYDTYSFLVPCHNDTVPENFLVSMTTGEAYLIDWEYAGMNSLYWDIAGYILESRLPTFAIDYLLQQYFQRPVSDDELMKIKLAMLEQDFLWTNWALIRHYNGDDFLDYCAFRHERLRKNIDLLHEDMHTELKNLVL